MSIGKINRFMELNKSLTFDDVLLVPKKSSHLPSQSITKAYVLLIMLFSVLLFGFLITYTFNTLFVIGGMYLLSIPVSFFHLRYLKNKYNLKTDSDESLISEDVL